MTSVLSSKFYRLIFVGIALAATPFFAAQAEETFYTATQYEEGFKFREGHQTTFRYTDHGFHASNSMPTFLTLHCKDHLMSVDQAFSLQTMLSRGYITQEEFEFFSKAGASLEESQVVFFHEYKRIKISELGHLTEGERQLALKRLYERGTLHMEISESGMEQPIAAMMKAAQDLAFDIKSAALYAVRGQGWDPYLKRRHFKLPWQKEESFAHASEFSRIELPLVWELGRAAQAEEGKFRNLIKLAVVQMSEDARTQGVPFEKSTVFIHALKDSNRKLYERDGFVVHAVDPGRPENVIMRASLATLLQKYPIAESMASVRRIRTATQNFVTPEHAVRFQRRIFEELFHAVDLAPSDHYQRKPLFLINELFEIGGFLGPDFRMAGIPSFEMIHRILGAVNETGFENPNIPREAIIDPLMRANIKNSPRKTLRIQNIDPEYQLRDRDYVARVLMAVSDYYRNKIRKTLELVGPSIQFPEETPYAIVTSHSEVIAAAKRLGATEDIQESYTPVYGVAQSDLSGRIQAEIPAQKGRISYLYFTESAIRRLRAQRPDLDRDSKGILSVGKWQERLQLQSPPLR